MANTIMTKHGMDFVTSAGDAGIYIAVKYCVPVYDYRLDTNVHDNIHTYAITYDATIAATSAQTVPTGEKIWFTLGSSDYTFSQQVILSGTSIATSGTNTKITGSPQSTMGIGANLYKGVPLSNSVSGTTFYPPSTNNFWLVDSATSAALVGVNATAPATSAFWPVGDYFPVVDGSGNIRGGFKAHLSQAVGRFKFNKLALYAVQMLNGVEVTTTAPVFFAEAFIKEVAVKSNVTSEGIDDFIVDCQIDLTPMNAYGTSGFFSTSGDYWTRTVGGLYSPDPVGIGSFQGSVAQPQANLHVRYNTTHPVQNTLLRLDASGTAGDTNYQILNVAQNGDLTLSGTGGDFNINDPVRVQEYAVIPTVYTDLLYANTSNISAHGSIVPDIDTAYDLGTTTLKWYTVYADILYVNEIATNVSAHNILPLTDSTYDLGSPDGKWNNGYFGAVTTEGVNADIMYVRKVLPTTTGSIIGGDGEFWDWGYFNNVVVTDVHATNVSATDVSATTIEAGDYAIIPTVYTDLLYPSSFNLSAHGSIVPDSGIPYDLGANNLKWNTVYANDVQATNVSAAALAALPPNAYIEVVSNLLPSTSTVQLGSVANPYNSLYSSTVSATSAIATSATFKSITLTSGGTLSACGILTTLTGDVANHLITSPLAKTTSLIFLTIQDVSAADLGALTEFVTVNTKLNGSFRISAVNAHNWRKVAWMIINPI